MITFITAMAAAAAAQTAQPAPSNPHAQHQQGATTAQGKMAMGQMQMAQMGQGCCAKTPDGKMECQMMKGQGSRQGSQAPHQGHSGN